MDETEQKGIPFDMLCQGMVLQTDGFKAPPIPIQSASCSLDSKGTKMSVRVRFQRTISEAHKKAINEKGCRIAFPREIHEGAFEVKSCEHCEVDKRNLTRVRVHASDDTSLPFLFSSLLKFENVADAVSVTLARGSLPHTLRVVPVTDAKGTTLLQEVVPFSEVEYQNLEQRQDDIVDYINKVCRRMNFSMITDNNISPETTDSVWFWNSNAQKNRTSYCLCELLGDFIKGKKELEDVFLSITQISANNYMKNVKKPSDRQRCMEAATTYASSIVLSHQKQICEFGTESKTKGYVPEFALVFSLVFKRKFCAKRNAAG